MGASYQQRGNVAVITLDNPPVNGLGYETRRDLSAGVERALADAAVAAIVVTGAGRAFSGGADIREFGTPKMTAEPSLHTVIQAVEASSKPVVAAVHGVAMGGGLELALACDLRVAEEHAQMALPEATVGLLPCAGGTQWLAWAVGESWAKRMVLLGERVDAATAARIGLVDEVVPRGGALQRALAMAAMVEKQSPTSVTACKRLIHGWFVHRRVIHRGLVRG